MFSSKILINYPIRSLYHHGNKAVNAESGNHRRPSPSWRVASLHSCQRQEFFTTRVQRVLHPNAAGIFFTTGRMPGSSPRAPASFLNLSPASYACSSSLLHSCRRQEFFTTRTARSSPKCRRHFSSLPGACPVLHRERQRAS